MTKKTVTRSHFVRRRNVVKAIGVLAATAAIATPFVAPTAPSGHQNPGVWRWSVKTLSDLESSQINKTPIHLSVSDAEKFAAPKAKLATGTVRGFGVEETKTYAIDAFIIKYKAEADGDYHVLLSEDGKDTTHLLGVEVVRPDFAANSPHIGEFSAVRQFFESLVSGKPHSGSYYKTLTDPIPVHVVGIGFWDETHGQEGMPSGFEIHPVIDMSSKPSH